MYDIKLHQDDPLQEDGNETDSNYAQPSSSSSWKSYDDPKI